MIPHFKIQTAGYGDSRLVHAKFISQVNELDFRYSRYFTYHFETMDHSTANYVQYSGTKGKNTNAYWLNDDMVLSISTDGEWASVLIYAVDEEGLETGKEFAYSVAPEVTKVEEEKVYITFWCDAQPDPSSVMRNLEVPQWDEIQMNYTKDTKVELETLINKEWRPGAGGQLLLWHGPPGTGKTTALRSMAREWRDWCEMHYIVDPERFFGGGSQYMMKILTATPEDEDKWRLLILEDCGELLATNAKALSGQGLARFLNAVDGLIGQSLKIMILVSTNEEMGRLNEAVRRPGRCAANIAFGNLNKDEAIAWAKAHKAPEPTLKTASLAELYAIKDGRLKEEPVRDFGFGS